MISGSEGCRDDADPFWIGRALLSSETITAAQLASAKQVWRKRPREEFGLILEKLGLATAHELARVVARRHGLGVASLDPRTLDRASARLLPLEVARKKCILPYRQVGQRLQVAIEDPASYGPRQARIDFPVHEVQLEIAPRREILGMLEEAWKFDEPATAQEAFAALIREAAAERATDLHLEPHDHVLDVRLRIDGRLVHRRFIEAGLRDPLIQAAKIAGRMDIAERRLPQDGQGTMAIGGRDFHLRFSCLPAVNGESIAVRIIDDRSGMRSLADLGLLPEDQARLQELLALPNGLVYVTGPTGSGKTTLLYSMLRSLPPERLAGIKIVTLEEPVEVRQPRHFVQLSVDERIGRTFSELLRQVLRHDPDIVLVGETRDQATAEITLRAALTGRLCLSTLHTNDAVGALVRLEDIGLDPVMLASALRGVVAQRLVRVPCPHCRQPHPQGDLLMRRYAAVLPPDQDCAEGFVTVETGRPCPVCGGRGYHGRTAIVEICPLAGLERLIAQRAGPSELWVELRKRKIHTLFEDGVRKAARGLTTLEEVYAAVEAPESRAD